MKGVLEGKKELLKVQKGGNGVWQNGKCHSGQDMKA